MKKFKTFREEVMGSGTVSGLGLNTGNPAVNTDELDTYINTNMLAKDQENGYLSKYLKDNQSKIAKQIGFKSFEPKQKDIK